MKKFLLKSIFVVFIVNQSLIAGKSGVLLLNTDGSISVFESMPLLKLSKYPFLGFLGRNAQGNLIVEPTTVRWPAGAMQGPTTFSCTAAGSQSVTVEVFKAGVTDTDPNAAGAGIDCVIHLGKVAAFGGSACAQPPFSCIQNFDMAYAGADNGTFDVFTGTIDNLPPGIYEYTCACTDNGPLTDPLISPASEIRWIGDEACPGVNSFVNGRLTVNGASVNDDCAGALPLAFGSNTVDNECTSDARAWFSYTTPNDGIFHKIDVDVLQGAGSLSNPQFLTLLQGSCGGTSISPASLPVCLAPNTTIYIEAGINDICGTSTGTFQIDISEITTVTNDICDDASALNNMGGNNVLACGESGAFTGNSMACPDTEATCFGATTNGVWYSFTVSSQLPSFSITTSGGGTYELFEGNSCSSLTSIGCAVTNQSTTSTTTYWLLVGPNGTVTVESEFDVPSNDDCTSDNALPVGGGTLTGQSNICANSETMTCNTQDDNVVWYSFTMPANMENATITVTGTGTTPISSPAIQIYSGSCPGTAGPASWSSCSSPLILTCLTPGATYYVAVGSAMANAGTFSINITFADNGVANDVCITATTLTIPANCQFSPQTTTTTNACPETFSFACNGGNNNADPTVWMQFTPPAGVNSINIRNITPAGAYLSIINACGAGSTIPGGGCLFGAGPTPNIPVTPDTTYYIMGAIAGGSGAINFDIRYNTPPANDLCANSVLLSDNTAVNGTTACATPFSTSFCGLSTTTSHTVFYRYVVPAGNTTNTNLEITVTPNTLTTGTGANTDINLGLFTDCTGTVYNASVAAPGDLCTALGNTITVKCVAPGTTIYIAVGSADGNEGDFSINVNETNTGVPANDLCSAPTPINFTANCDFVTVTGTTLNACPESVTGGACSLNTFPTVWYSVTLPAGGVGFGFDNLSPGLNIAVYQNNCPATTQVGTCITSPVDVTTGFTPNTPYLIAVRNTDPGAAVAFDIKAIVPPANDLCANSVLLSDNTAVNGTTACATPFGTSFCGLSTTTSHTVFYRYVVPAGNTTNTNLEITVTPNTLTTGTAANTDINLGLFTDCAGTVYNASVAAPGDLCTALGNTITVKCVAPGTTVYIAVGSANNNEGDFSINVNETNTGIPANDLCSAPTPINFTANCDFVSVTGTTLNACPESVTGGACSLNTFPTVWYSVTLPAGGVGFGFDNLSPGLNIAVYQNNCPATTQVGTCITSPVDVTTGFTPNTPYLIAVRNTDPGAAVAFDIKAIVPPANDLCANSVLLSDNTAVNGTTACATPFGTSFCGLSTTTSHTVFYRYVVPAGNTTNTNLEITVTPNTLTTGTAATNDINLGLFTDCAGTVYNASVEAPGDLCTALGNTIKVECVAPGTTVYIAVGSANNNEGDFSINVNETNTGIPANDLCSSPTVINITNNCIFQTVNGTTLNACPELFTNCGFNTNPTVWYSIVLPANGIGFSFQNLSAGLNIGIFDNACPPTSQLGPCITANIDANGLTPGTYLLGVRNSNPGAPFSFEIRTNLQLPNDNPCQAGFTSIPLSNNTPLAGQNNVCATSDNPCGGNAVQNTLWYTFTLPAGSDRITVNVTGLTSPSIAIYNQANPCMATAINSECNGDGMVEFNCLQPGTYQIMVGTSAANAGNFSITAIEGNNSTVPNDVCSNATALPGQPYALCVNLGPFSTTNINACPELPPFNVIGNCNILTEETSWYQFTAPGNPGDMPTMDFRFTSYSGTGTPFMVLFNGGSPGSCGSMTQVSNTCNNGINTVFTHGPLIPGNTYYIALSSFGDTGGNFIFEVKFNLGPPNDDNCDIPAGYNLGTSGSLAIVGATPVSNSCAGADVVITECPLSSSESSVWFKFTVSPGNYGITVQIRSSGGPNDISGNVAAAAFQNGCTDENPLSSVCFPVNQTVNLDCLAPGTYDLQISGPAANDGNFRIVINQLADTRNCNGAPLMGDACANAINIPLNAVCTPIPVSGCNNNACPETFNFSPCLYNQNPTIWYRFTVAALVTSIDITNMTSGFTYGLLAGSPCTDSPVVGYNNLTCLNGTNNNIPVTAGQTYYMLVSGTGTGGSFNFNIVQNVSPVNDDPDPSSANPPYLLTLGGSHVSTTCCAIGFADDPAGDLANVQCNTTTHDGAVWYRYVTGTERAIRIQVTPSGTAPINGVVTVEVVSGATQPGNALFAPTSYYCGNVPATVSVGCYDPNETMWIKVASANANCGSFSISITELSGCPLADLCTDATNATVIPPIDASCSTVSNVTIPGCIEAACPETTLANCNMNTLPTVWFQIQTTSTTGQLSTTVTTPGSWTPIWSIWTGPCNNLVPLASIVPPPGPGFVCSNQNPNPNVHTVPVQGGVNNYWIAVSGQGVIDNPNFTLTVSQLAGCISCIGDPGCPPEATWTVTSRSTTRPLNDPFFCQGEDVRFCVNFRYDPTGSVAEWIQGIIPDFGPGWDLTNFNPASATITPSSGIQWQSETAGACAPRIQETMPFLCTYTDPVTGRLKLCNFQCQNCPCTPPLAAGSPLPSGWYYISTGGSGCANNCSSSTRWGLPGSSVPTNIQLCLQLKVRTFNTPAECEANKSLRFSFQTTSDGVSGCWEDAFECKFDYAQIGPNWQIDCDRPPKVVGPPRELCKEGNANLPVATEDGTSNVNIDVTFIDNPNVSGENNHTFTGGAGIINDYLINNSGSVQIVRYIARSVSSAFLCPSPSDTLTVTLYPELNIVFNPVFICEGSSTGKVLTPIVTGGSGVYTGTTTPFVPGYNWSTGAITPTITVNNQTTQTYTVTVTDNKGCSNSASITVQTVPKIEFDLSPEEVTACSGTTIFNITNLNVSGNYNLVWFYDPGVSANPGTNQLNVNLGGTSPIGSPYEIIAQVTDANGCIGQDTSILNVGSTPYGELEPVVLPSCNEFFVDLRIKNFSNATGSATFVLLDCDGNQVYGGLGPSGEYIIYNQFDQFQNVNISLNNCFKLLITTSDGCTFLSGPLTIPIPTGTQVNITSSPKICQGGSVTLNVTNFGSFNTFKWSNNATTTSINVMPSMTTQYSITATQSNGCTSVASSTVTVNPLPQPGISGSLTFCDGDTTQLTASGGTIYKWAGPGGFSSNTASSGPITVAGMYTVTVTDANGCTATKTENIMVSSSLTVVVDTMYICDMASDSIDAGVGFDSYEWRDALGNILATTQKLEIDSAGIYTVNVSQGLCLGTGEGVVINNDSPSIDLPENITVCRLNTGIGPVTIDFQMLADTSSGTWFNIDNAPVSTIDWSNVDFTPVPTRDTFRFVYVTSTAVAPCEEASDTVTVIVRNCACPNPGLAPLQDVCNSQQSPVNLNNAFVDFNHPPGFWTVISPSPMPFPTITDDSLLLVNGIAEGLYNLRYTFEPPTPGTCIKYVDRTLSVYNSPVVILKDSVLCNADIGAGPVSLNLNDLIVSLNEPSPGSWIQIGGNPAGGSFPNIDVTGMAVDTLIFEYTTTALAPCDAVSAISTVRIRNCSCPDVILKDDLVCNGDINLLDLENANNFTVNPATVTGTWQVQLPLSVLNGHFINVDGVASGTYSATFTISGNLPAGCASAFTKIIEISDQPTAEKLKDGSPCSTQTGNGDTFVNLYSLLKPGYSNGGTWTQISPATPQLTIPVTGLVDFVGLPVNSVFGFRYTVSASDPCQDAVADVIVNVKDCNCPDTEINCLNCKLCNDAGLLDLTTTINNPTTIGTGTWSVTDPDGNNITLVNGIILDAKDLTQGPYNVRYTLNPAPSGSCPKFDEFGITIETKDEAVIKPDTLVCNGDQGITSFNLSSMFLSGASGQWFDADGTQILNYNLSIAGLPEGTMLSYTYVIDNADPCLDNSYPIVINITANCNCQSINLGTIPEICTNAGTLDLKQFSDPKPGTWSAANPALVITNGVLDLTNVPAGVYQLTYTLTNPEPNCPTTKTANITVSNPKSAGTARGAEFCVGATDAVKLADRLDAEDTGGTWTVVSGDQAGFNAATGEFNLSGRAAGTYVFKYAFANQAPCPNDEEEVTIIINALPVADAGTDKNIDCTVQTAVLGTDNTSAGTNILYEWKLDGVVIATTKNYTANQGGDYTLTVQDTSTNCSASDIVKVIQADDLPIFDVDVDTIACFGQRATITVSNIRGGQTPYQISFDGGTTYGTTLVASNLRAGSYKVLVKDANGCVNDQLPAIVIVEPPLFAVNLGNDFILKLGEDSLLTIKGQYNEATAQSVTWKANGLEVISAKDMPELAVAPQEDTEYEVTVVNQSGCIATDNLRISIQRVKPECVPNIFTPNNVDGNNYFSINCDEVDRVTKYRIYDRWGNLIFTGENLLTSEPQTFWDGKFKGKPVVAGVYVYYIEMLFKDGSTEKRGGDVTVLR